MKISTCLALVALPAAVHATAGGNGNGNSNSGTTDTSSAVVYVQEGGQCKVTRQGNNYIAVDGFVCDPDGATPLECAEIDDSGSNSNGAVFTGTCGTLACHGKANPDKGGGSSNGNGNGNNGDTTATNRVTICHRTCSTNNPWVRITIDKDAWGTTYLDAMGGAEDNGTSGCGHKLQHNVTEDCNRNDYSPWAPYFADYLIKDHGLKDTDDKDYWKIWEPACPYVRNGACCSEGVYFQRQDGQMVSDCCGDAAPTPAPVPAPTPPVPGPDGCSTDMGNLGTDMCPGVNVVKSLDTKGPSPPADIIFDIKYEGPASNPVVKFKVDNPYDSPVDVFVEYHDQVGEVNGAFDADCEGALAVPGCNPGATEITAACLAPEGKTPFSVVRVYFVKSGSGSYGATVPECCTEYDDANYLSGFEVVEYTYEIMCGC